MQDADIYLKTDAGRDEIKSRARGLPMASRAILLMVDGQRDVAALRSVIAGTKAPGDTLETLLAQGLIAPRQSNAGPTTTVSIATPRSATMARTGQGSSTAALPATAPVAPRTPQPAFAYDTPLDLALPTILEAKGAAAAPTPNSSPEPVAATSAQRYEHLYTMMNEVVRDFLPAHRRYFIQLKIERCGTSDELLELLEALHASLAKSRGDAFASEVVARLRAAAA